MIKCNLHRILMGVGNIAVVGLFTLMGPAFAEAFKKGGYNLLYLECKKMFVIILISSIILFVELGLDVFIIFFFFGFLDLKFYTEIGDTSILKLILLRSKMEYSILLKLKPQNPKTPKIWNLKFIYYHNKNKY